jgi:hypothetical protein
LILQPAIPQLKHPPPVQIAPLADIPFFLEDYPFSKKGFSVFLTLNRFQ